MKVHQPEQNPVEITAPLSVMFRSHLAYMSAELKSYGFGWGHFEFLMILYHRKEGLSQECLSRVLRVSKATGTRAIGKLESEGYVIREKDKDDRRVSRVYLTDKGRAIQKVIWQKLSEWVDIILADFTFDERQTFKIMLKRACYKAYDLEFSGTSFIKET